MNCIFAEDMAAIVAYVHFQSVLLALAPVCRSKENVLMVAIKWVSASVPFAYIAVGFVALHDRFSHFITSNLPHRL